VILWFAGVSFAFVWLVFRSPALDYRLVMLGSILPVGELVFGGPRLLHTLVFAVALMGLVMLATQRRRLVRRRLISLPIGIMMHLVLDGIWARTSVFWWPFFGWSFDDSPLPELDRGWWSPVLEVVGVALCVWLWRHNSLGDSARRAKFRRDGQLDAVPERFG